MKKIISFSLWGAHLKYCVGAIKNARLAQVIYPDWVPRFYCDYGVPISTISELETLGAEVVLVQKFGNYEGMFWRFDALDDSDIVLVRDADSRLGPREKILVDEWLASDKLIHSIHDHPYHRASFMPGLSGFKRNAIPDFKKRVRGFLDNCDSNCDHYGIDYEFFHDIMTKVEPILLRHDAIYERGVKISFPCVNGEFCGRVFDENDETVLLHDEVLANWKMAHAWKEASK